MSVVTLEGEIIHYEVLGRGRPLIFLHGWVGSWRYWVPTMQSASISFRAYAIDMWGFGDTAKRPAMYTLDEQVKLLENFLESLGIGRIAIIGHGLGALVGLTFASRHTEIVDRMMLTGMPLESGNVNPRLRSAPVPELVDWLLVKLPVADSARIEAPKADLQAIQSSINELQNIKTLEVTQSLSTPCLFVHGQNDPAIEMPSKEILNLLPEQAHYVFFEQSGHFPMLDETVKYNRLLSDFLSLSSGESPRNLQLKDEWKRRVR
jgi:pimeloyl-ACP methyl ester carboxylesterase